MMNDWKASLGVLPPGTPDVRIRFESDLLTGTLCLTARDADGAHAAQSLQRKTPVVALPEVMVKDWDEKTLGTHRGERNRPRRRARERSTARPQNHAQGHMTASSLARLAGLAVGDVSGEIARQVASGNGHLSGSQKRGRGWVVDSDAAQRWLDEHRADTAA